MLCSEAECVELLFVSLVGGCGLDGNERWGGLPWGYSIRGAILPFCFLFSGLETLLKALVTSQTIAQTIFASGVAPATSQAQHSRFEVEAKDLLGECKRQSWVHLPHCIYEKEATAIQ